MQKLAKELTAKGRKQIAEGNFALPDRRYPIHDESHARNALARVAQHGTPGEKAQVRSAVKQKYPGIEQEKGASLCEKIAGTLNESDFERFNEVYEDPRAHGLIKQNSVVMGVLSKLASKPMVSGEKLAAAAIKRANAPGFNVVQIRPHGYGYHVKFSAAPANVNPQEAEMTAQQAQQALPQEALDAADQQGAATLTDVQAEPDPMAEKPPAPIDGFGLYKVMEQGTGKQIVGYVIPGLFDPMQGGPSAMSLFTNGGQYALQPNIVGSLLDLNFNIPHSEYIRGMGIFYKSNGKALMATVPYNIMSEITTPEGRKYYAAQDPQTGAEVQVTIGENLMKPLAVGPGEVVIPDDFQFLALDNEIALEGAPDADPMAAQKAASMPTMMELRAWDTGCRLDGPVFEKIGSGEYDWADGLFWMACAGIPHNLGVAMLEKAASSGQPMRMYGCRQLTTVEDTVKEAAAQAETDMARMNLPERKNLLLEMAVLTSDKQAAAMVDADSVDAVLALNFVNPENISTFLEELPALEKASTKLASLVLATQLGLQSVPKTAAVRAMFALEDVITGLKSLQEYKI